MNSKQFLDFFRRPVVWCILVVLWLKFGSVLEKSQKLHPQKTKDAPAIRVTLVRRINFLLQPSPSRFDAHVLIVATTAADPLRAGKETKRAL